MKSLIMSISMSLTKENRLKPAVLAHFGRKSAVRTHRIYNTTPLRSLIFTPNCTQYSRFQVLRSFALVAQWIEQFRPKEKVVGSTPTQGTI